MKRVIGLLVLMCGILIGTVSATEMTLPEPTTTCYISPPEMVGDMQVASVIYVDEVYITSNENRQYCHSFEVVTYSDDTENRATTYKALTNSTTPSKINTVNDVGKNNTKTSYINYNSMDLKTPINDRYILRLEIRLGTLKT